MDVRSNECVSNKCCSSWCRMPFHKIFTQTKISHRWIVTWHMGCTNIAGWAGKVMFK
ncbi:unnamed protein product [Nesidiocoris tenuis]|uniref:Uncharacterized protein n=1 Tax=Nesidiocoris tenuis TaxID=355587 RepID=A0A6H5HF90_9HEMI|nr:unnamed protein product [Nesidiocoris tenuis]